MIHVLHLSDIHATSHKADVEEIDIRVAGLVEDLNAMSITPSIIVLTGDIAYSGDSTQFKIARNHVVEPIRKAFNLSPAAIFICPGNHDIDRSKVNRTIDLAIRSALTTSDQASNARMDPDSMRRLEAFYAFASEYRSDANNAGAFSMRIDGIDVGLACFNSAWRCFDEHDKNNLFITLPPVRTAIESLSSCPLRVALFHHPMHWLHDAERHLTTHEIANNFHLILTGHTHDPETATTQTPDSQFVLLTAPAFYSSGDDSGYSIYSIDISKELIDAKYRTYVRRRRSYDMNVQHAPGGQKQFRLSLKQSPNWTIAQRSNEQKRLSSQIDERLQKNLEGLQGTRAILIRPNLKEVEWKDTAFKTKRFLNAIPQSSSGVNYIFGKRDSGKSILLQATAKEENLESAANHRSHAAIYADARKWELKALHSQIDDHIETYCREFVDPIDTFHLLIDNLPINSASWLDSISDYHSSRKNTRITVTVTDHLILSKQGAKQNRFESFFYLEPWGPSRIREAIEHRFNGTSVDPNAAYRFIVNCLKESDLQATPLVVLLFLSVFPLVVDDGITSIQYVRMLEKYEDRSFGNQERSAADSQYNKRRVLAKVAQRMYQSRTDTISVGEFKALVQTYFDKIGLIFDLTSFAKSLFESNIIQQEDSDISFTCYVFQDFYLAQAINASFIGVSELTSDLSSAIEVGEALAIYAGLDRARSDLPYKVLDFLESEFDAHSHSLESLDNRIKHLFLPQLSSEEADSILDQDIHSVVDYNEENDQFERSQDAAKARRKERRLQRNVPVGTPLLLNSLQAFYKIFRNLENLESDDKLILLDRILDYHITCNIELVDCVAEIFDEVHKNHGLPNPRDWNKIERTRDIWRSATAYIATLAGTSFLSSHLGTQTLQLTIERHLAETTSDFKKLLLTILLADLRMRNFESKVSALADTISSPSGAEILFLKVREILIETKKEQVGQELTTAFRKAHAARTRVVQSKPNRSILSKEFTKEIDAVNRERLLEQRIALESDSV